MCTSPVRPSQVKIPDGSVEIENAACPRCDGSIYHHPTLWLFCPACTSARVAKALSRPIPFALARTEAAK